ncbi:MAG: hypothetical protein JW795_20770 [Chitinivibrionales bacterium]|nr:hypothetical protein [Chitinivibrionales bacterium]
MKLLNTSRSSIVFVLACVFFLSIQAQTLVDISGKVTDNTGKAVADATIALKNLKNVTTKSIADGTFKLQQGTGITNNGILDLNADFCFLNDFLVVNQKTSGMVTIAVYNLKGSLVSSIFNGALNAGSHTFSVEKNLASSMHIIGITQNNATHYVKMGSNVSTGNTNIDITYPAQRAYAAVDSIIITKTGFARQAIAIDNYVVKLQDTKLAPEVKYPKIVRTCGPCSKLSQCVARCPNGAITNSGGRAVFNKAKCQGVGSACKGKCIGFVCIVGQPSLVTYFENLVGSN